MSVTHCVGRGPGREVLEMKHTTDHEKVCFCSAWASKLLHVVDQPLAWLIIVHTPPDTRNGKAVDQ